ncbi:hypothetical protein HRbin16_02906 [bacterium HR16]|nr:hypothetical protein HRbin16_02906 [bacterium HR16]
MRLVIVLIVLMTLLPVALADEHDDHGHHHEPHHWESTEMRHEILTQLGGIVTLGVVAGSYLLVRRRMSA